MSVFAPLYSISFMSSRLTFPGAELNTPLVESDIGVNAPWQRPDAAEHADVLLEVSLDSVVCAWLMDHEKITKNRSSDQPNGLQFINGIHEERIAECYLTTKEPEYNSAQKITLVLFRNSQQSTPEKNGYCLRALISATIDSSSSSFSKRLSAGKIVSSSSCR